MFTGFRFLGLLALVPTSVLLCISFFVLFTIRKTEAQGLKVFGFVITALLWIAAVLVFSTGIYLLTTGNRPMKSMMKQMMPMQHRMAPEQFNR